MSSFLNLIDELGAMEGYSLLFIGGAIGSLLTYLAFSKGLAGDDNKKIVENSLLERPIIFIDSGKIIKRSMFFNYAILNSKLDVNQLNREINQKLSEFLKNYTKDKGNVVVDIDGLVTGAIDLTHDIGDNFIFHLDKMERFK